MSRAVSTSLCLALIALLGCTLCEGYISIPLTGYQQGITLQIVPPASTNEECYVYGVPTPFGYAPEGATPLSIYTYKNTGSHVLQFVYKTSDYDLAPVFIPGDTTIQVDTSVPSNPLVKFDSNQSPQGKYAYVSVQLLDKRGNRVCVSSIAVVVEAPLSCLPTWGGVYNTINPTGPAVILPSNGGQIVVPGGNIYAPTYVQNTIIQQFITINNVNINNINIVNNVQAITNITIIQNVTAPPTPAPVNCTTNPTAPACRLAPGTQPVVRPPAPGIAPGVRPPAPGTAPVVRPPSPGGATPPVIPINPSSPITPGRGAPGVAPPTGTGQTPQPPARAPTTAPNTTVTTPPTQAATPPTQAATPPTQSTPVANNTAQAPATGLGSSGRRFRA